MEEKFLKALRELRFMCGIGSILKLGSEKLSIDPELESMKLGP